MKDNKGITLIALVITIVVLIILAGISISIMMGEDGLITKARQGAQNYQNAAIEEQNMLNTIGIYTDLNGTTNGSGTNVQRKQAQTITPGTEDIVIPGGTYLDGDLTIKGNSNLKPEYIKDGVSIFGITGTLSNSTGDVSFSSVVRGSYGSGPIDCNVGDLIVVGANHSTINASGATLLNSFHAGHSSLDCYIYFYRATSEQVTFNGGSNAASAIWHSVVLYY